MESPRVEIWREFTSSRAFFPSNTKKILGKNVLLDDLFIFLKRYFDVVDFDENVIIYKGYIVGLRGGT